MVDSLCPYCGVVCQLTFNVKDEAIAWVDGRDGPANAGRMCVKGRYGFDYVANPQRLTKPLIRRDDVPKSASLPIEPANPWTQIGRASWRERVCQYVEISVVAGPIKKKTTEKNTTNKHKK